MHLDEYLSSVIQSCDSLESVSITDNDGVLLSSVGDISKKDVQLFSVLFNLTTEQCEKIESFGDTKYILIQFNKFDLIQFRTANFILSVRARKSAISMDFLVDVGSTIVKATQNILNSIHLS
jgi:Mitogen-activated protein kinase kinase 1 interacting